MGPQARHPSSQNLPKEITRRNADPVQTMQMATLRDILESHVSKVPVSKPPLRADGIYAQFCSDQLHSVTRNPSADRVIGGESDNCPARTRKPEPSPALNSSFGEGQGKAC